MKCEDVDPSSCVACADLHLGGDLPSGRHQPPHDMVHASDVTDVSLPFAIAEERPCRVDDQSAPHRIEHDSQGRDGQVSQVTVLDRRDERLRYARLRREPSLRPANGAPQVAHDGADPNDKQPIPHI